MTKSLLQLGTIDGRPRSAAARFKEVIECWQKARIEALRSKPSSVQLPGWFFEELCRREFDSNISVDVFVVTDKNYRNRETGEPGGYVCHDVPFTGDPNKPVEYSAFVFPTQEFILHLEALLPDHWKEIDFKDSRKRTFRLPAMAGDSAIRNGVAKLKRLANGWKPKKSKKASEHPPHYAIIVEKTGTYTVKVMRKGDWKSSACAIRHTGITSAASASLTAIQHRPVIAANASGLSRSSLAAGGGMLTQPPGGQIGLSPKEN